MSKPTPGPWRASHDSHGRFQLIADGIPLDPERDGAQPGEGAANAALIAAAPDLLAALEQLVAWVDDSDESHTTVPPACQKFGVVPVEFQAVTEARAAINKAGGAK